MKSDLEQHLEKLRRDWKKYPNRRPIIERWAAKTKELLKQEKKPKSFESVVKDALF